jgi:hypothetical protein
LPRRKAEPKEKGKKARKAARRSASAKLECALPRIENERTLALDSSSVACGWSVFEGGALVAHGRYCQAGKGHGERLANFRVWLLDLMDEWKPDVVMYEAPYRGRSKNTFGVLVRYVAVIEAAHFEHYEREIGKTEAVAAHTVKRAIGAPRGASHDENKRIVMKLVNSRYRLRLRYSAKDSKKKKVSQDDNADAIALNWAWHELYRGSEES